MRAVCCSGWLPVFPLVYRACSLATPWAHSNKTHLLLIMADASVNDFCRLCKENCRKDGRLTHTKKIYEREGADNRSIYQRLFSLGLPLQQQHDKSFRICQKCWRHINWIVFVLTPIPVAINNFKLGSCLNIQMNGLDGTLNVKNHYISIWATDHHFIQFSRLDFVYYSTLNLAQGPLIPH